MLEKSVGEECWRDVAEKCWRDVVEKCWRKIVFMVGMSGQIFSLMHSVRAAAFRFVGCSGLSIRKSLPRI